METIKRINIKSIVLGLALIGTAGFAHAQTNQRNIKKIDSVKVQAADTTTNEIIQNANSVQTSPTIEALKKQIAANPNDTESLAKLATEYQNVQNWTLAVDTWKKLSTLLPDWAPSYYSQAYAYQSAKDNANAKTAYETYISKVKPEEVEANKKNLAYAYFFVAFTEQQANPEKAKQYIAKSLEYDPANADAVNLSKSLNP